MPLKFKNIYQESYRIYPSFCDNCKFALQLDKLYSSCFFSSNSGQKRMLRRFGPHIFFTHLEHRTKWTPPRDWSNSALHCHEAGVEDLQHLHGRRGGLDFVASRQGSGFLGASHRSIHLNVCDYVIRVL